VKKDNRRETGDILLRKNCMSAKGRENKEELTTEMAGAWDGDGQQ